jgi:acyl-CoA dehydrogenase
MISLPFSLSVPLVSLFILLCGYFAAPIWVWSLLGAIALFLFHAPIWIAVAFIAIVVIVNIPILRRMVLTQPLMNLIHRFHLLPSISATERAAIDAGTVWVEGEFFSGKPDLQRLAIAPYPTLSSETQAFLDGPVEQVCRMVTDWEIHRRKDLPPEVWSFLKQAHFFGMMIPKDYGGLGFSNLDYSAVMMKLASRSFIHTATVGVTNSLGPAKLLLNYGTEAQKQFYLPRLAAGEEIPCFALTEPLAGSDAASITAEGIVFLGEDGQPYLRLNFSKRYITLGAIATLIGLAFQLRDPDNLLGKGEAVGITCALVPANTPGLILGKRHDPMGVPFYNSPIAGQNVVISVDQIIGGVEQAGQGWKMLMQSLAAGRGISFPATCTGIAKLVARVAGNHAVVRKQFGLSVGRFEGVMEPLARIGGITYMLEAARIYTCAAVDAGERPAVASAIAKYQFTERSRQLVNDGMDILGGSGICRGPRNLLANIYTAMPIPITVEGANILTRTLMIFGQGIIRCHPYLYDEIIALEQRDAIALDHLLWRHLGWTVRNGLRAGWLSVSSAAFVRTPGHAATAPYYRRLMWASAMVAFFADVSLITLGSNLKRRESLTGRFADVVSGLYLGSATLRRFEAEGCLEGDRPFLDWAMQSAFGEIQQAFVGILQNLPGFARLLAAVVMPLWRLNPIGQPPQDNLSADVAQLLQTPGETRDRLTQGIYRPTHPEEALGRLEQAHQAVWQADLIWKRLKAALQAQQLQSSSLPQGIQTGIQTALAAGLLTPAEAQQLQVAEKLRTIAIQVDAFTLEEYQSSGLGLGHQPNRATSPGILSQTTAL